MIIFRSAGKSSGAVEGRAGVNGRTGEGTMRPAESKAPIAKVGVMGLWGADTDGGERLDEGCGFRTACFRAAAGLAGDFGDRIPGARVADEEV